MCPGLSPTPRANPALQGTCRQRRWPCRGCGCRGQGAAHPHPSWLVGSHEASVCSQHSLTPGKTEATVTEERTGWQPPQGQYGAVEKVVASGPKIWLSHCETLHKSPQFPHLLNGDNNAKKQPQSPKEKDRMELWDQGCAFFWFLLRKVLRCQRGDPGGPGMQSQDCTGPQVPSSYPPAASLLIQSLSCLIIPSDSNTESLAPLLGRSFHCHPENTSFFFF